MANWKTGIITAVLAGAVAVVAVETQQSRGGDKQPALTEMDYIEIQQLLARYGFALDTGADNGYMYADLYTPDGIFNNRTQGREALAALARGGRRGPLNVRNLSSPAIIKPSAEGATGIQYAQAINFGENRQPTELDHFAYYQDVYVKTADGWRFKSRAFVNESGSLRAESAPRPDAAAPAR